MKTVELRYDDGRVEVHAAPRGGPHFLIGMRYGKSGPTTWFVLERRDGGVTSYVECAVEDDAGPA